MIKKENIFAFVLIGSVLGYPFVAGFSATFGLSNSILSLTMRSLVGVGALLLLMDGLTSPKTNSQKLLLLSVLIFFFLYFLRLIYSTIISSQPTSQSAVHYWVWTVGSTVIPFLGLAFADVRSIDLNRLLKRTLIFAIFASVLIALNITTSVTNEIETYDSGRARLASLNPISLGHLGVSLLISSLAYIITGTREVLIYRIIALISCAGGAGLVMASNSRGPIVAAFAALLFGWLGMRSKRKTYLGFAIFAAAIGFAPTLFWLENTFGVTTYSRLFGQSFATEINVVARLELYIAAFQEFSSSPLLGAGLEVAEIGSYPHNVTIEAFLTTGLLGGSLFLVSQLASIFVVWQLCRKYGQMLWAVMIIVQYIIAAQFSGSVYAVPQFWAVMGFATFLAGVRRPIQNGANAAQHTQGNSHA